MTTFLMFGNYTQDALKAISVKRTNKATALIREHGGEMRAGYALLGEVDLVLVIDLPDVEQAMKVSVALTKLLGIAFRTAPAVSVEDFDKLMG